MDNARSTHRNPGPMDDTNHPEGWTMTYITYPEIIAAFMAGMTIQLFATILRDSLGV